MKRSHLEAMLFLVVFVRVYVECLYCYTCGNPPNNWTCEKDETILHCKDSKEKCMTVTRFKNSIKEKYKYCGSGLKNGTYHVEFLRIPYFDINLFYTYDRIRLSSIISVTVCDYDYCNYDSAHINDETSDVGTVSTVRSSLEIDEPNYTAEINTDMIRNFETIETTTPSDINVATFVRNYEAETTDADLPDKFVDQASEAETEATTPAKMNSIDFTKLTTTTQLSIIDKIAEISSHQTKAESTEITTKTSLLNKSTTDTSTQIYKLVTSTANINSLDLRDSTPLYELTSIFKTTEQYSEKPTEISSRTILVNTSNKFMSEETITTQPKLSPNALPIKKIANNLAGLTKPNILTYVLIVAFSLCTQIIFLSP